MQATQKPKGNILAGICFLLLAVSCLPVLFGTELYVRLDYDSPAGTEMGFIKLLPVVVYLYLGVVLLARRRGGWLFAGFLALTVMALGAAVPDPWFRIYFSRALPGVNILNKMFCTAVTGGYTGVFYWFLYPWYQGVLYAAAYLFAGIIALRKEKVQKLRLVPVILVAVSFVFMAFSVLRPGFNEQFMGYPYADALLVLLVMLFVVFLVYLVLAGTLFGSAVWCVYPNGKPVGAPRAASQPPYAPPQGTPAPGGPRMTTGAPQQAPQRPAGPIPGAAEELKQYKELLDMGAITQEEYDQKKKQLLGL